MYTSCLSNSIQSTRFLNLGSRGRGGVYTHIFRQYRDILYADPMFEQSSLNYCGSQLNFSRICVVLYCDQLCFLFGRGVILCLTSRMTVTSARGRITCNCYRASNFCVFSHVQKGILGLMHKWCVLQRLSFDAMSEVTVVLEMRQSIGL